MNWSIERKLPLFVTTLLVAVAIVQLTVGYGSVRKASRALVDKRLPLATKVLADLFQTGQLRTRVTNLAKDPAILEFLRSGGHQGRQAALAAMQRVTPDTASSVGLELRDFGAKLLLRTGRFAPLDSVIVSTRADSAQYGPLLRQDTTIFFGIAATAGSERGGGIVQQVARLDLNERTRAGLNGLAGGDVELLLGNATGEPWTDFATIVPAPPETVLTSRSPVRYMRGEMKRAASAPVPDTPWMVVAELPVRAVAAPARAYLINMAPIALLIAVIGAIVAWWGSRRVTVPLREVTAAADALTAGNLNSRAPAGRADELGRLAQAFNTMAEQVSRSQQHLEAQVTQRTKALEGTNAELESFSYSVSHDLRAPLRAIHGFARILIEDHRDQLGAEAQRLLGVIDQNTKRMGQLIDDLLAFSRLGRQELGTGLVDMREVTHAVADDIQRGELRNGGLDFRIAALPPAQGDRALLRQVVSNLLQNAAKFTRGCPHARIEVGWRDEPDEIVYFVKDNGAGFDPRYMDKLFGVFQRLHRAEDFEGTGVGLAIVKRIVQRHGGRVWAEAKPDEGATFYFTLPRADP
ncbi:MAG: ATP-binding protein [Gemmatimonadales bacterium]